MNPIRYRVAAAADYGLFLFGMSGLMGRSQDLAVQSRQSRDGAETFPGREIEGDGLVLGHAVEIAGGTTAGRAACGSASPFGEQARTRCPSVASDSRTLVAASGAPNGRSLDTMMLDRDREIGRTECLRRGTAARRRFARPAAHARTAATQLVRRGTTVLGREAKNKTMQTQRSTMSLYRNSPVRFHAMGSVDILHLTTPGVVKKNDHVMMKVPTPINEPIADRIGMNAPAASNAAVVSSTTPRRSASPLIPNIDNQETNGLLDIYRVIPCAD